MESITWDGLDHPHETKSPEWYVMKWVVATAAAVVCVIFGNILLGVLVLAAAGALSVLAARPLQHNTYTLDTEGLSINTHHIPFSAMYSHEFLEYNGEQLLALDTKHVRSPRLLITLPEEHVEDIVMIFKEHGSAVPEHTRGIPLSHMLMEVVGL